MNYSLIVFIFLSPMTHSLRPSPDHSLVNDLQLQPTILISCTYFMTYLTCTRNVSWQSFSSYQIESNGLPIRERAEGIRTLS